MKRENEWSTQMEQYKKALKRGPPILEERCGRIIALPPFTIQARIDAIELEKQRRVPKCLRTDGELEIWRSLKAERKAKEKAQQKAQKKAKPKATRPQGIQDQP